MARILPKISFKLRAFGAVALVVEVVLAKEAPANVGPGVTLAELGHSPDPLANEKSGRIYRILVVDDDPFCCDIIARRLAGEGYEPVTALSAHMASEAIQRQLPDAVLLDVTMPQIDGISYLRML